MKATPDSTVYQRRYPSSDGKPRLSWALVLFTTITLLGSAAASAADRRNQADAQATYQSDRAACLSGRTNQDRATCLREASAARQEARRGGLDNKPDQFEKNRMMRCDSQPAADRADCVHRMNGEGSTSGSVDGGGIYRELVVPDKSAPLKSD
jgi:hypothetical protein